MARAFGVFVLVLGLTASLAPGAQPAEKRTRLGFLWTSDARSVASYREAFGQGLRGAGHVEGRSVVIEHRYGEDRVDRLPGLATELVRLRPTIIVTQGTPAAHAAKAATSTIPVVMLNVGDPVSSGLVESLARPGGNLTGLTVVASEMATKRLQLLKEIVPDLSRVAVLSDASFRKDTAPRIAAETTAQMLRLNLQVLPVQSPKELDGAFASAIKGRAQALLVLPSPILNYQRTALVDLAAKHQLPASYQAREFVDLGGLMSYGPDLPAMARRAAEYVDKILRGTKPAELPVEQPSRFDLALNLKTAQALGLTIPPSMRLRASHLVE